LVAGLSHLSGLADLADIGTSHIGNGSDITLVAFSLAGSLDKVTNWAVHTSNLTSRGLKLTGTANTATESTSEIRSTADGARDTAGLSFAEAVSTSGTNLAVHVIAGQTTNSVSTTRARRAAGQSTGISKSSRQADAASNGGSVDGDGTRAAFCANRLTRNILVRSGVAGQTVRGAVQIGKATNRAIFTFQGTHNSGEFANDTIKANSLSNSRLVFSSGTRTAVDGGDVWSNLADGAIQAKG